MSTESEKKTTQFATVHGSPGQNPRILGALRVFWPLAPICLIAGYLLRAALPAPEITTPQAGILFVTLAGILALFILWSSRRLQSFLKGAEGEEVVARALSCLPAGHTVFNDIHLNQSNTNCDHVVVAPSGIFVIETKNWSGDITFKDGQVICNGNIPSRPPLNQVKNATACLMDHLHQSGCPDAPMHPVLCFAGSQLPDGPHNISGVQVCTETELHTLFENTVETQLPADTINSIINELKKNFL